MQLSDLLRIANAEKLIDSLADKLTDTYYKQKNLTLRELYNNINEEEAQIVKWLMSLRPENIEVHTEFRGYEEPDTETDFEIIERERTITRTDGTEKTYTEINYVPRRVYKAWNSMLKTMEKDISKSMIIFSGYRSPAYQVLLICYKLSRNNYNPDIVFHKSSLPGFSQHGLLENTALDIDVPERLTDLENPEKLASTPQYQWLLENANKFGFVLSYPKDNEEGIDYEPWHWQWRDF